MDGVIVDLDKYMKDHHIKDVDDEPHIFLHPDPIKGSIEAIKRLYDSQKYDLHIASSASWRNVLSFTDKRIWIEKHFGSMFKHKFTLTHTKHMLYGDILIDDRTKNGAGEFRGRFIHFGTERFPHWQSILDELLPSDV